MKNILLLICLVAFSFSYGSNSEPIKIVEKHVKINHIDSFEQENFDVEYSLIPIPKEELKTTEKFIYALDCGKIALAVFDAAADQGYSADECYDMAYGVLWTCTTFQILGENL